MQSPCGVLRLLEVEGVVVGADRLKAEHFDKRSRLFVEVQACLDYFGIVENHQAVCRQAVGEGSEYGFGNLAVAIHQQFGLVAYGQRELGNAPVGQRIVEFTDFNMSGIFCHIFVRLEVAKVRIFRKICPTPGC